MKEEIVITMEGREDKLVLKKGEDFFRTLIRENIFRKENCGGRGVCGRCKIQFLENAPLPVGKDRRFFTPGELREGFRLACFCKPVKDCTIRLFFQEKKEMFVLSDVSEDFAKVMTRYQTAHTFVIADLGSTTIVMQLVDGKTGKVIKSFHGLNPQRKYGSDVVSRMEKAMEGATKELSLCVKEMLLKWLEELDQAPVCMFIAGNTVMEYLFMEYEVDELSKAPFLSCRGSSETKLGKLPVYFVPRISAFVGGDIFAGIYATLCMNEEYVSNREVPKVSERDNLMKRTMISPYLLVDLGTNGEIVLVTKERIFATATAAGPAFEGGANAGVYGSDMVELVANLLENHVIDEYGTLIDRYENGISLGEVFLKQEDIRALQLAKAAVRAGIECLMKEAGLTEDDIEKVYLAGGFGYKMKIQKAAKIGLLPKKLISKTTAVGNTALAGAFLYACSFLQRQSFGESVVMEEAPDKAGGYGIVNSFYEELTECILRARVLNLAKQSDFQQKYIEAINLCE